MTPVYLFLACIWLAVALGVASAAGLMMLLWYCFGFGDPYTGAHERADVAQSDRATAF
jgi:amino acid transporter